jgi:cbb3-type cytochrome oxidase subunit 3
MMDFIATYAGTIGLLFFLVAFVIIMVWVFSPTNREVIESHRYIPLMEKTHEPK